jgi:hypothetical protein
MGWNFISSGVGLKGRANIVTEASSSTLSRLRPLNFLDLNTKKLSMHPDSKLTLGIDEDKSCSAPWASWRGKAQLFFKLSVVLSVLRKPAFALFLFRVPTGVLVRYQAPAVDDSTYVAVARINLS